MDWLGGRIGSAMAAAVMLLVVAGLGIADEATKKLPSGLARLRTLEALSRYSLNLSRLLRLRLGHYPAGKGGILAAGGVRKSEGVPRLDLGFLDTRCD